MSDSTTSLSKIAVALNKAQGEMSGAKKDAKNEFFKSKYVTLESVFDAIRKPFSENGLSITQTMDIIEGGKQIIITRILHVSGEYLESKMLLPTDPNPQKLGSAITYFRRYSLMAICGLPAEDDDGNEASGKKINPSVISNLEKCLDNHPEYKEQVMAYLNKRNMTLADIDIDFASKVYDKLSDLDKTCEKN